MKTRQPVRSYLILGIYSLLIAAFYKWEASLFVLSAALFIEMVLLFIGAFFTKTNQDEPAHVMNFSGATFALLACFGLVYPMTKVLAGCYDEFDYSVIGHTHPLIHYGWQIMWIAFALGVGYLVDFKRLRSTDRKHFITYEVYRVCFLLFGVTLVGLMCEEWIEETRPNVYTASGKVLGPFTAENKMIPIIGMICARMAIEIWYIRKVAWTNGGTKRAQGES